MDPYTYVLLDMYALASANEFEFVAVEFDKIIKKLKQISIPLSTLYI